MGFFKDFKDDFSQAVNELIPEEDGNTEDDDILADDDMVVDTLDLDVDMESGFSQLNGLLEQVVETSSAQSAVKQQGMEDLERNFTKEIGQSDTKSAMEERTRMNEETSAVNVNQILGINPEDISDETTVITEGAQIKGDISSDGSIDIRGKIKGNVKCNGKLMITGVLEGDSNSSEFFADAAKIDGEVQSTGTVKIGIGSVVIGNITATSAVVAGAVKGDIDVRGPVVIDTSAVIMGNIKSRSVQINNGAVIEGFCSLCYAEIDMQGLFDEKEEN